MLIVKSSPTIGNAIIESLKEIYSNESGNIIDTKLLEIREFVSREEDLFKIFNTKQKVIFLGGNHMDSSVWEIFLETCKKENKKPCLIIFDSHLGSWFKPFIEGGFPPENVLLVGTRNLPQEEIKFIREKRIKLLSMNALTEDLNDMCDTIMEFSDGRELYISINLNIIDPAFAPSVFFPEIGGLTSRQFIFLIHRIKKIQTLRIVDIVGIKEENESNLTLKMGAKILAELI